MPDNNTIPGNLTVQGRLTAVAVSLPAACVGNNQISGSDKPQATNLEHQHQPTYGQPAGVAAITERKGLHLAYGAGTVIAVKAKLPVANVGAATVTVDVLKNGTTILSAPISFVAADGANAVKTGTITVPAYVASDQLDVSVTATAGGGTIGQNLSVSLTAREAAN